MIVIGFLTCRHDKPSLAQTTHISNKFPWSQRCSSYWSSTVNTNESSDPKGCTGCYESSQGVHVARYTFWNRCLFYETSHITTQSAKHVGFLNLYQRFDLRWSERHRAHTKHADCHNITPISTKLTQATLWFVKEVLMLKADKLFGVYTTFYH